MSNFTKKNENRKRGRKGISRRAFLEARALRRNIKDGAFGRVKPRQFNNLAVGTTGTFREEEVEDAEA